MKMLLAAAVVAASATLASHAMAQTQESYTAEEIAAATAAIEELALEDDAYRDLWCGAAFIALNEYLTTAGDTAGATAANQSADVLFARVEPLLSSQGLTSEQLGQIGASARIVAVSEITSGGEVSYSQEECTTAAQAQ